MYQETIPKIGKHKNELGVKTGLTVEFVKIEIMIDSCRKLLENMRKQDLDGESNIYEGCFKSKVTLFRSREICSH